jgi:tetratricopeptide (TPR) repeat protein
MDRIAMLQEILEQAPDDAFARYGLALEYSNSGQTDQALDHFGKLLSKHPDYTAGYFMAAQSLAKAERIDEAKKMLGDGIASAKRTGNAHALAEMQEMLESLG